MHFDSHPPVTMHLLHSNHVDLAIEAGLHTNVTEETVVFEHDAAQDRFLKKLPALFQGRYKYEIRIRLEDMKKAVDV